MVKLTLWTIEATLAELVRLREDAEIENDSEAVEQCDKALVEYFEREIRKVDGIAGAIRAYNMAAESAALEAERLSDRAKAFKATAERIKRHAQQAMEAHGVTKLETPTNTLRIQANGGLQPLEVYDPMEIKPELRLCVISMNGRDWDKLRNSLLIRELKSASIKSSDPDNLAIRDALKLRVVCPECKGAGNHCPAGPSDAPMNTCQRCEGKGTIPNTVPGAKLLPRGRHLRIE